MSGVNLAIAVAGMTISTMNLVQALINRQIEKRTRAFLLAFFFELTVYGICNLLFQVAEGKPGNGWGLVTQLSLFFESALASVLVLLLAERLLSSGDVSRRQYAAALLPMAALWVSYISLLIYTQFSTAIYYFDDRNLYHRGPYYPALLVPPVLMMLETCGIYLFVRHSMSRMRRAAYSFFLIPPLVAIVTQMFFFGLHTIVFGIAVSAFFMFTFIEREQTDLYIQKERENTQLRIDMMLSQMKPHFLYNALGAISALCRHDREAKEAINNFSRYLRHNTDSLFETHPIPFSAELEHTRVYLELEQLRFQEDLQVEYHLECTAFSLPTLTLQPLAENAVRHGIRGTEEGTGTVVISTRETPECYEITVTDDGAGFDPERPPKDDGKAHIGLRNVRERLRRVCGGELRIDSAPGQGCRAQILIPKE